MPPPPSKTSELPSPEDAIVKVSALPPPFNVSPPEPLMILNPLYHLQGSYQLFYRQPLVKLAVPAFVDAFVATKFAAKVALQLLKN